MRTLKEKYDIIENLHRQKAIAELQCLLPYSDRETAIKNLSGAMAEVTKMYLEEIDGATNPISSTSDPMLIAALEVILYFIKYSYPDAAKKAEEYKIEECVKKSLKGITTTKINLTDIFKNMNGGRM